MFEFEDWDAFDRASDAYQERFGERPPLVEMPADPEEQLAIIRDALEQGRAFAAEVPAGAVI